MIALPHYAHATTVGPRWLVGSLLQAATTQLTLWAERRQQRRQLLTLNDQLLKDIGISRAETFNEGDKPFWRA